MNEKIRQIIREEVFMIMKEFGKDDPVANAQAMVKSNEEQVKSLKDELKWKDNDSRVSGLPIKEKEARVFAAKAAKDKLKSAENELALAKQAEINAVIQQQAQSTQAQDTSQTTQVNQSQNQGQSQVQSQGQSQVQSQI